MRVHAFVDGEGRRRLGQVCLRLRAASPSPSVVARLGMTGHARCAAKGLPCAWERAGEAGRASVMLCFTVELTTFKAPFWARSTDGGNRTLGQMVLETIPLYTKLAGLFIFLACRHKESRPVRCSRRAAPAVRDLQGHGEGASLYCRSSFAQSMKLNRP